MKRNKDEVVTFKADAALLAALQEIPNRSAFIRTAILQALENVCPLCQGTGVLSTDQKKHWGKFAASHPVIKCHQCHELHLVCSNSRVKAGH